MQSGHDKKIAGGVFITIGGLALSIGTGLALDLDIRPCASYRCSTMQADEAKAGIATLVIGVVSLAIGIPVYAVGGHQMRKAKLLQRAQPGVGF
jgi:hypothetical protein